ncbi:DUF5684 domain-containing protein [Agromyces sp. SYSU T00194]|uniref:DUF5684 domain-containing protein n=1 Tax=Agromyces chitinivorans TaxID=3158560 RepID=UPI003391362D
MISGRAAAIAALAVGMLLTAAPAQAADAGAGAAAGDVEVGSCVDLVARDGSGVAAEATVASCDAAHDGEVYARLRVHGAYPGHDALLVRAAALCDRAVVPSGLRIEQSVLEAVYRIPDEASFADRPELECVAVPRDGSRLATSLAAADAAGTLADPDVVHISAVRIGECLDPAQDAGGEFGSLVRLVDCDAGAAARLVHREDLEGAYPGTEAMAETARAVCSVAIGTSEPEFAPWVWYPASGTYLNEPTIECAQAVGGDGALVRKPSWDLGGASAGSGPTSPLVPPLEFVVALGAFVLLGLVFVSAVLVGSWVLMGAGLTVLFGRVGIPAWRAWVPLLRTYSWLRLGGQPGHLTWLQLVPGGSWVTSIFLWIGMHRTGLAFGRDAGYVALGVLVPFVWAFTVGAGEAYRPERIVAHGYPPPAEGTPAAEPEAWWPGPAPSPPTSPLG